MMGTELSLRIEGRLGRLLRNLIDQTRLKI